VSSLMHRMGADIHFGDLEWERKYNPNGAYAQSKLANLLFALELQRRSDRLGWGLLSDAAHPGGSSTDLIANGLGEGTLAGTISARVVRLLGHSAAAGALPTLFAATSPTANPGGYYGPDGMFEMRGAVAPAFVSAKARNSELARRLWDVSEELTGVRFPR
jgi:NAD(P)-dependent dehydrogenase (short-subunit alcohol dehydrogenase family)